MFDKKIRVEWQASDPDGDELAYSVSYSVDQGKSFRPIEGGLKKTKLTLSTLGLGGSKSALLKVTASDGFNAVEVISEPFVLQATTAPIATILWPKRDHIFTSNKALLFRGTALDLQDESLTII